MSVIDEILKHVTVKNEIKTHAQVTNHGISCNISGFYTQLIKDAARCNNYSSDVIYSINDIYDICQKYDQNEEYGPFLIGMRKLGVDSNAFIEAKCKEWTDVYNEYFALYSVEFVPDEPGWIYVVTKEYIV